MDRNRLMKRYLMVARSLTKATTNYERRHLTVEAQRLQAQISKLDGAELFKVV